MNHPDTNAREATPPTSAPWVSACSPPPHSVLACWALATWQVPCFCAVASLLAVLISLGYFLYNDSLLSAIMAAATRVFDPTEGNPTRGMSNLIIILTILFVLIPGFFLIHRFKLRLSLSQMIVFSLASAVCLKETKVDLIFIYFLSCAALESLFLLHLWKKRPAIVDVIVPAVIPIVLLFPMLGMIVTLLHPVIIVLAATPPEKNNFTQKRRFWPESHDPLRRKKSPPASRPPAPAASSGLRTAHGSAEAGQQCS